MDRETFDWIEDLVNKGTSVAEILTNPSINYKLSDEEYRTLTKEYVLNSKQSRPVKDILNDLLEFGVE